MKKILFLILILILGAFPVTAFADVMSSSNYKIFSDVISAGGAYSTSANYGVFDALSEVATNPTSSSSSNFQVQNGFFGATSSTILSVSLSTNSIDLGTLNQTQINTATQTVTVTTNSFTGYTTTIQEDHDLTYQTNTLPGVAGASVTIGTPGYGIITSGTDGKMNRVGTALTTSAQTLAQSTIAVIGDQTTITYKASMSGASTPGTYTQTVTLSTTANF